MTLKRIRMWAMGAAVLSIAAAASCGPDTPSSEHAPAAGAPSGGAAPAAGVDTTVAGSVRVLVADTLLTLSKDGVRTEASLQEYVNSSGGYSHRLLDARTGDDKALFLLIQTRGASRPDSPEGRCGAGEETNVTWLQVDSALRVVKGQTVLPASCLRAHEPAGGGAELASEPLSIAFHIPGDSITTASYDRRFPERGLRVTTAPDTTAR
jgi:hypothetical protein